MFPSGWERRAALVIQSSKVSAALTDFPVLLTEDTLPSEMFDADGSSPAQNGGGDIRFSSDESGATQLACEIWSFVTDNDPANGTAEIWVKVPSVSSSADTTIYVWYNTSGTDAQPAVDAAFGRNAVWSDYLFVSHDLDTDSTGNNSTTITGTAAMDSPLDSGRGFGATLGSASTDAVNTGITAQSQLRSYQALFYGDTFTSARRIFGKDATNGSDRENWVIGSGPDIRYERTWDTQPSNPSRWTYATGSADTWQWRTLTYDSGNYANVPVSYLDGAAQTLVDSSQPTGGAVVATGSTYILGNSAVGDRGLPGGLDEFRIRNSILAASWVEAEYNNQSDPATFVVEGTAENPTVELAPATAALVLTGQSVTVSSKATTSPDAGAITLAGQQPTAVSTARLAPGAATVTLAGQTPTLVSIAAVAPSEAAITLTGNAVEVVLGSVSKAASDTAQLTASEAELSEKYIATLDAATLVGGDATTESTPRPAAAAITLAGQLPTVALSGDAVSPHYADIRMQQGEETRPTVNTQGDNDKAASDTAGITGTEWPFEQKDIATYDEAQITPVYDGTTQELWTWDQLGTTATDQGYPFNAVRPAWAELLLEGQQPGVSTAEPDQTAVSPNTAQVSLLGGVVTVLSNATVSPAAAAISTIGQAQQASAWLNPDTAAITLAGLQPGLSFGTAKAGTDTAAITTTDVMRFLGSSTELSMQPPTADIVLGGEQPVVRAGQYIAAGAGLVSIEGLIATIHADIDWTPGTSASASWDDDAGATQTWTDVDSGSGEWSTS